jgi:hypothetical protein
MRETAEAKRQAARNVASLPDSARELGFRDAQVSNTGGFNHGRRRSHRWRHYPDSLS